MESTSVILYRETNSVQLIPIDLPTPDCQFFEGYAYLQKRIESNSRVSRRLLTLHKNYVHAYGFSYLTSELCSKEFNDIYVDEIDTIKTLEDTRLTVISELWKKVNELREIEMMKNIYKFCINSPFEKGAFLIGAARRQSIIDKTTQNLGDDSNQINWDISSSEIGM